MPMLSIWPTRRMVPSGPRGHPIESLFDRTHDGVHVGRGEQGKAQTQQDQAATMAHSGVVGLKRPAGKALWRSGPYPAEATIRGSIRSESQPASGEKSSLHDGLGDQDQPRLLGAQRLDVLQVEAQQERSRPRWRYS